MSHEFEKGFSVRQPAWHGLATVLSDYPGRDEAMKVAGHDWNVLERPLYFNDWSWNGADAETISSEKYTEVGGFKALIRDDNNSVLSVVRDSYTVVQNAMLWDIVDMIVNEPNVKYETAGVLKNGTIVWVLAKINEPVVIKGDQSYVFPYVQVSTSHDGSQPCRAQSTAVRVVCWNTHQLAESESANAGTQFTFRHTKNVDAKIEDARAALGLTRHLFEDFIHMANELAGIGVTATGVKDFIEQFVPMPKADVLTDRVKNNIEKERQKVREIIDLSITIPDEHRRTSYGLYCAGVEYMDHMRRFNTPETYFRRTMFDYTKAKQRIAKLATKVAV